MPRKPAVEVTPDGRVYLIDDRNITWRVYDIWYGPPLAAPFHYKAFRSPHDPANGRYFVAPDGKYRSYQFTRDDTRDITAETLNAQLRKSGFPETKRFDGAKHYTPGASESGATLACRVAGLIRSGQAGCSFHAEPHVPLRRPANDRHFVSGVRSGPTGPLDWQSVSLIPSLH